MPKVVFITLDGAQRVVDAHAGESVMAAAVRNGVPGIIGECGGNCSCATCHVYVADDFAARSAVRGTWRTTFSTSGSPTGGRPAGCPARYR